MGSRTVPNARMVIGREGWALAASRRRVMLRRKGGSSSFSSESEVRDKVGDEVVRDKVRRA